MRPNGAQPRLTCDTSADRVDAFVNSLTHDLKDPLQAIVMGASHLLRTLPDGQTSARVIAEAIRRSAERVNRTIDDLRDLDRLGAGSLELRLERHPAEEIAQQAALAWTDEALRRRVALDVLAGPGLHVRADRPQLVRALGKIIDNAIQASTGGRVRVGVARAGDMARFSVTDDGPGIPPSLQETIFLVEPGKTRRTRTGPGLSLPLVKGIVELHGGEVTIESAPGQGSTFFLTTSLA